MVDKQKDAAYSPSHCSQSGYYCFEQPNEIDTISNDNNVLEMIDASKALYPWISIFKEGKRFQFGFDKTVNSLTELLNLG